MGRRWTLTSFVAVLWILCVAVGYVSAFPATAPGVTVEHLPSPLDVYQTRVYFDNAGNFHVNVVYENNQTEMARVRSMVIAYENADGDILRLVFSACLADVELRTGERLMCHSEFRVVETDAATMRAIRRVRIEPDVELKEPTAKPKVVLSDINIDGISDSRTRLRARLTNVASNETYQRDDVVVHIIFYDEEGRAVGGTTGAQVGAVLSPRVSRTWNSSIYPELPGRNREFFTGLPFAVTGGAIYVPGYVPQTQGPSTSGSLIVR